MERWRRRYHSHCPYPTILGKRRCRLGRTTIGLACCTTMFRELRFASSFAASRNLLIRWASWTI
ncbi:hypothetical protein ERO13_A12G038233v2 [Gossypium hirsutum]|uniref:Uncharacterized protein n=1 Tax=Gossypium darwinii TaxID=34276 RepID=A0A5D2E5D9_GOSDA|nr:hypothetical protein ERO13_A12G038233v2 [Gossypium hirsutum]TYG88674.1 hypothetical protein ES288_A12G040300v1 [Gossypium darwinii]